LSSDGTTALIGAPYYEQSSDDSGAAYVFTQDDGSWSQQARLTPANQVGNGSDEFGKTAELSDTGDRALVGAPLYGQNGNDSGAAYVFSQAGETWSQEAVLLPEDNAEGDRFGSSVGLSTDGTMALVGAEHDGATVDNSNMGAGYVFDRSGSEWTEEAKITADDGDDLDNFGDAVALSGAGSTAVVGAPSDEDGGSAYVFTGGSEWTQESKLTGDNNGDDDYGDTVAVSDDGGVAIVGAPDDEDPNGGSDQSYTAGGAGAAYVYD
jgi:hypothetical protein